LATALTGLVCAFLQGGDVAATPATPGGVTTTILATSTLDPLHIFAHAATPGLGGERAAKRFHWGHSWKLWLMTQGLTDASSSTTSSRLALTPDGTPTQDPASCSWSRGP
jgi:hypothetical protein